MEKLFKRLQKISVSSLADVDKEIRVVDGSIRRYSGLGNMVGVARVVSCHNDFLKVLRSLETSLAGEVLVVAARTSDRAVLGSLFCTEALRRGLAGVIVDGPIRDVSSIEQLELPVYARYSCPCAGTTRDLSATIEPVLIGETKVFSGDILVGDKDGVIIAKLEHFESIVEAAEEIEEKEFDLLNRM